MLFWFSKKFFVMKKEGGAEEKSGVLLAKLILKLSQKVLLFSKAFCQEQAKAHKFYDSR